jgi:tetratricopeptide (TPR) repeat protein
MSRLIGLLILLAACSGPQVDEEAEIDDRQGVAAEAFALDGQPLMRPTLDPQTDSIYTAQWVEAAQAYESNPQDVEALIWLGRRTAYLWRYQDAVGIFTNGIRDFPDDARLYRHRGHRYLTLRQFDAAIADLTKASELIQGRPDQIEPDGQPNAANIPVSTLGFNIWYHLGLAHFFKGDWDAAAAAFTRCLEFSANDDAKVSTYDWLFMSLRRAGRETEADALLAKVRPDMTIHESFAYHRRLLMYKGLIDPDALLDETEANPLEWVTQGYGLAFWMRENGDSAKADSLLNNVISTGYWAAFGYIAAEADLNRRIF